MGKSKGMPIPLRKPNTGTESATGRISLRPRPTPTALIPTRPRPIPPRKFSDKFNQAYQDPRSREANRIKATEAGRAENRKLTRRQRRFLAEILIDPKRNAVQAAIRAGYKETTALSASCEFMKHPQIKAAIEEADKRVWKKLEVTHERVLQEVANIAFASMGDYLSPDSSSSSGYRLDLTKVSDQQMGVVKEFTEETVQGIKRTKISLYDKLSALQVIGKHLGMFKERMELSTPDGKPLLTINILDQIVLGKASLSSVEQQALPKGVTRTIEGRTA